MKKGINLDTAVIEGNLPAGREDAITWGGLYNYEWLCREVSRSRSTYEKRVANSNCIGLTSKEGRNVFLLEIRMGALLSSLYLKYKIVVVGVKSDTKMEYGHIRDSYVRWCERFTLLNYEESRLLDVCCVIYDKDGGRSSDEGF
ncbi:hypothetical protein Celal_3192 [Cellulophaga algicola DSM 14237]|uniref:Uncharacterized protein n=1 Tax=Cellulophaga algicola (strain DSM 14237 / IC166 / ACAM 630) TaxID=688270 RepID=E6X4X2_CELAD|nr:hypothetical protein Celal_3192 [Cellulophaga algicola DSM 14237]